MFPYLRKLKVESEVEPNEFLCNIHTLKHLEHLAISGINWDFNLFRKVDESAVRIARELKQLRSFRIIGLKWDELDIEYFLHEAENLTLFECFWRDSGTAKINGYYYINYLLILK